MPIRAQDRWLYPIDWPQLSALIRFGRAKGRCERCARPHANTLFQATDGTWWDCERSVWRDDRGMAVRSRVPPESGSRTTRVFLATAHLDHDPGNSRSRNLAALCQRCHLRHDRAEHRRRRLATLRKRKAIGDLFLGIYPSY
jgi:hypothetical protein